MKRNKFNIPVYDFDDNIIINNPNCIIHGDYFISRYINNNLFGIELYKDE